MKEHLPGMGRHTHKSATKLDKWIWKRARHVCVISSEYDSPSAAASRPLSSLIKLKRWRTTDNKIHFPRSVFINAIFFSKDPAILSKKPFRVENQQKRL
ncbi:hypothetical protein JTE90_022241 [Oedothorax gibbosus]|uniref:Uncharacterized protein n=1 Tax=Oedothorax gibbosus TaxID=931172 RepID=A0AAV6VY20_9ARAC|nr:hypothetical protein JTE90_022241 [Oedothorax gibbosus]